MCVCESAQVCAYKYPFNGGYDTSLHYEADLTRGARPRKRQAPVVFIERIRLQQTYARRQLTWVRVRLQMLKCNNIKLRQYFLSLYSKSPLLTSASMIPSTANALLRHSLLHTLLLLLSFEMMHLLTPDKPTSSEHIQSCRTPFRTDPYKCKHSGPKATALILSHNTIQYLRISSLPQRQIRGFVGISQRGVY